jgi:HEAT repeat protein/beta-lactamase regulating signal transducer with metallopeptidase domain
MRLTDFFSAASGTAWLPLADAILKATLLFAAAGLASLVLRRASAATRHLLWMLALVSALALPVLSLALPRWQLPIVTLASSSITSPGSITSPATTGSPTSVASTAGAVEPATASIPARAFRNPIAAPPAVRHSAPAAEVVPAASPEPRAAWLLSLQNLSWPYALLIVWTMGAALVLLRLLTGLLGVQWLSRRTERVTDAPWLPLARSLASGLGLSHRLVFLRSGRAAMPMAWGILHPAVLMPSDADTWPSERLRIVLLHELAHVKRRDCLTHMLAQISCALYWFNPLVWMAARHLRTERERACDDLVLAAGTRGPDYAEELLEIARVMRAGRFPAMFAGASLAMAQRSQLEGRLMAILDPTVPRSGVSRFRTMAASSLFACAVMPLASVQPWGVATPDQQPSATVASADQATPRQAEPVPVPAQPQATAPTRAPQAEAPATPQPVVSPGIPHSAVEATLAAVHDSIPSVVASVLDAVGPMRVPHPNVNANIHLNSDIDVDIQNDGGKKQPVDPRTVAALTAALKDIDKDVRETALQALVQLRDPGIYEPLIQALADAASEVRERAAFGLGQMRDKRAVEPLARALKDQSGDVREQAAFALGQIRDRAAIAALTAAIKDVDDDVREQAVFALGQLRDPAAVDALALATHDAKADVRHQAVFALGQIRDARAVEPLISALKDADPEVREQAAFALGQIRDRASVEALVIALKDSVADVRQQVVFALGQIRDPRAIDGLTAALKDANADVRQQAAFALGQLVR